MAEQSGQSLERILEIHQEEPRFVALASNLEGRYPEDYLRASIEHHEGELRFELHLTQSPSDRIVADIRESMHADVIVSYGRGNSRAEYYDINAALSRTLAAHPDDVSVFESGLDESAHAIEVRFRRASSQTEVTEIFRKAVQAGADSIEAPLRFDVRFVEDVEMESGEYRSTVVQGGRPFISDDGGNCTAGFTARRNTYKGILTAAHCGLYGSYQSTGSQTLLQPGVAAPGYAGGGEIDLAWYRVNTLGGNDANNEFRATGRTDAGDREVLTIANPIDGQDIARWGDRTDYDASVKVANPGTGLCRTINGALQCRLAKITTAETLAGDSGGPWFFGSAVHGMLCCVVNSNDYITEIGAAAGNLDAHVIK